MNDYIADITRLCERAVMESRLAGIVATLWFFFALLSLFVASVISPMGLRLLLPGTHPTTWIYPVILTLPPVAIGLGKLIGTQRSRLLLWLLLGALGVVASLLFFYVAATLVGH